MCSISKNNKTCSIPNRNKTCSISNRYINFYCSREYCDTQIAFLSFVNDAKKRSVKLWMISAQKKMCLESQARSTAQRPHFGQRYSLSEY